MKNLALFLLLISTFICYSQETYTMKSGGRIFNSNNEKLTPLQVKEAFKNNPTALDLYTDGRTKKTMGNILLWGGIATFMGKLAYYLYTGGFVTEEVGHNYLGYPIVKYEKQDNFLFYAGAAMVAVSIPVKSGFQKKIRKSVEMINQQNNPDRGSIESANILVNANGVGISITY